MAAGSPIVTVTFVGHLSRDVLDAELGSAKRNIGAGAGMVVDCLAMSDYDAEARDHFVKWHREHRDRLRGVAVVTEKRLWHMIVSAMALASGQRMKAFDTVDEARAWLDSTGA
jgi:hypothetical protein